MNTESEIKTIKRMLCPVCKTQLKEWKELQLETLDDHISNPNGEGSLRWGYHCPDEKCQTRLNGIFWDYEGSLYINHVFPFLSRSDMDNISFINGNNAPFGTFERQMKIEVYKQDENELLITLPLWFPSILKGMKIYSEYSYKANEDGEILKRTFHFKYIRKDGCHHIWGISMLMFGIKRIYRSWKDLHKNPKNDYALRDLQSYIKRKDWDKDWWRNWSANIASLALWNLGFNIKG